MHGDLFTSSGTAITTTRATPEPALIERANPGLHEMLLAHLPQDLRSDAAILDLGCGTGAWLARLAGRGFTNLTGIDWDTDHVAVPRAHILRADLNGDWGLEGRYALITAIEVVEHIENLGSFFDGIAEHLDERGAALLTTPNIESIAARLRFLLLNQLKQFDAIGDATHLFPVVTATLPRIIERRGLRIAAAWGHPRTGQTHTSRAVVNVLSTLLRTVLPEPIPGDNLCLLLERR
jgi:SAM-dependent methyltransferase